ncbi:MAG: DUF424 family protein [Aigarchaeota archaeon]|nr:DUF424 family protein [Aigarchaeota archaeon]MDW8092959.1 DUF424 family protein [Nitrososphaerota archaeon]
MEDNQQARYWAKLHYSATGEVVLAACDLTLLGRMIPVSEDHVIEVSEEFYMGQSINWDQLLILIEKATIINLLGDEVVTRAIEHKILAPEAVLKVGGVSHAQIML